LELKDGSPQNSQGLDDAIWAIQHWGVQGIVVGGYSQGNASDSNKATALALADFVVSELAKAGVRAKATVIPLEGSSPVHGVENGVEFDVVSPPLHVGAKP
jgi:hypothetical protein